MGSGSPLNHLLSNFGNLGDLGKIFSKDPADKEYLEKKFPQVKEFNDKVASDRRTQQAKDEIFGIKP
jgi:phage FluMu protein Com